MPRGYKQTAEYEEKRSKYCRGDHWPCQINRARENIDHSFRPNCTKGPVRRKKKKGESYSG